MSVLDALREKAKKGLTAAQIELGHYYLLGEDSNGNEMPKDLAQARYWFERAHERGAHTAAVVLGTMHEEGCGVPVDVPKAVQYYEHAAQRGAYMPCIRMARIYAKGKGIPASEVLALRWYKKALSYEGQVDAESEMVEAREYLRGRG